jgi:hypothetical protein
MCTPLILIAEKSMSKAHMHKGEDFISHEETWGES